MNSLQKLYSKFSLITLIAGFLAMGLITGGCSDDDETQQAQYGYVQFKLYKSASFEGGTTTRALDKLNYLNDAKKMEVILQSSGSTITQSLVLNSYNAENAEFGLRSDKLQLLAGDYTVIGFRLYDSIDQVLITGDAGEDKDFTVIGGGLTSKALAVDGVARGMASFKLVKEIVKTRADEEEGQNGYPFSSIKVIDLALTNTASKEITYINKIPVEYIEDFTNGSADDSLYPGKNAETSYALCDTVVWLKAGTYRISSYTTYSDKNGKSELERASLGSDNTFVVKDNVETKEVKVPIRLRETNEYIKDYIALKELWEKMDGPNWSYYGEAQANGTNWNFNKDIDMWGDQPGVSLHSNGRVAAISLSGFGAKGIVPDVIGQFTELMSLELGSHSELIGGYLSENAGPNMTAEQRMAMRMDYDTRFLAKDPREGLSELMQETINMDKNEKPIKNNRISTKDLSFGTFTNGITGISKAIMRLTNLETFYLANSPITTTNFFREVGSDSPYYSERESWSWENFTNLFDIEIYNCPNLTALPTEMLANLPELQSLNVASNKGISGEQLKADWEALIDGNCGEKIQILYMSYNNLKEFPEHDKLKKMIRLGLLDCLQNQIEKVHPFGKDIYFSKIYLDYNKITEIPHAEDGYFCGLHSEMESFTCTNNLITKFPDIFNAKSIYTMGSIDFSYNQISEFENGDNFRGINASTVNLSNNRLETFPGILFKSGSPISTLTLSGNGMKEIPDGSLEGKYSHLLTVLDLSYNKLSKLSDDFYATNLPYLTGLDLSYNSFSKFPTAPLSIATLNRFFIRHQRDEEGNRTLREWPTGLYTCPSLYFFAIGSNDLRKIEDTISPYIYYFEIKDNPNISIDLSSVCSYIQAGYYLLIYDKTQDIRGCDALDLEQ